jgi:hypothetical protein
MTESGQVILTLAEAERLLNANREGILTSPWVQHFTRRLRDQPAAEECLLLPRQWIQNLAPLE